MSKPVSLVVGRDYHHFNLAAAGPSGTARPATYTITVSDYTVINVCKNNGGDFWIATKAVGSALVHIQGHSQDGTLFADVDLYAVTVNPVPVEQADHLIETNEAVVTWSPSIPNPQDQGPTITGSL